MLYSHICLYHTYHDIDIYYSCYYYYYYIICIYIHVCTCIIHSSVHMSDLPCINCTEIDTWPELPSACTVFVTMKCTYANHERQLTIWWCVKKLHLYYEKPIRQSTLWLLHANINSTDAWCWAVGSCGNTHGRSHSQEDCQEHIPVGRSQTWPATAWNPLDEDTKRHMTMSDD